MVPYYLNLCKTFKWNVDEKFVEKMKKSNEEELKKLENKIQEAKEQEGEIEIREACFQKANFYARIGDKENALIAFKEAIEKAVSIPQKMEVILTQVRIGFFFNDRELTERNLEIGRMLLEECNDWELKNRFKVYEGYYAIIIRNFQKAGELLLSSIATFTATELFDYTKFVYYTVLMNIITLQRVELKKKVIDSPEILSAIRDVPHLFELLNSLYNCSYQEFLTELVEITYGLKLDRILYVHGPYFCREMRIIGYSQFLESYKSVTINSMAESLGLSPQFLDKELSRFIASGRIPAKIDKVGGVIETIRPDKRNAGYRNVIKQGDPILNRIQKLSRIFTN
eukprot:Anaeramoba_ignava/c18097_g1_i1.p1 GENE.c18097_g1_i1~~c18097_g1_i1.p1  ORF type:complete len:341 (-),score=118.44 c18097_g1_i1:189-1211(-)